MACDPSYIDRIRRRSESDIEEKLALLQWVRASNWCVFADLGRCGQAAVTGLCSLSKHCWVA